MKKSAAKKAGSSALGQVNTSPAAGSTTPLVTKQPQSKQEAALEKKIFLHTDDAWSAAYFDSDDMHFVERELFG